VEDTGNNTFKTVFPSKAELLRMVEWGVAHTKFEEAKIKIEERMVDSEVKFVLPKVWIQFTGLPPHLQDYLILWAMGSIMGVTKDVDMEFTRQHGISRVQVMVMNPNLIPHSVNIVIGDGFYELKFQVKMSTEEGNPQPMDMDDNQGVVALATEIIMASILTRSRRILGLKLVLVVLLVMAKG
jgi:hypothetical protein